MQIKLKITCIIHFNELKEVVALMSRTMSLQDSPSKLV